MTKVYAFGSDEHLALLGKRLVVAGVVLVGFVLVRNAAKTINAIDTKVS